MSIQNTIKDHIENDYFTASIKCEVVIDTILTPMIGEIMSVLKGVDMKYVTKEFPFFKKKNDNHTINVDYMLYSEDTVYFVELKTTESSKNDTQDQNYCAIKESSEIKKLLNDFKKVLIDNLPTGYTLKTINEDALNNKTLKDILDDTFKSLKKKTKQTIPVSDGYTNAAKEYLKKTGKAGSSKYILQAGQIIDANRDEFIKMENYEFIYLLPGTANPKKGEYSIQDIISKQKTILKKIEKDSQKSEKEPQKNEEEPLKEYFEWLVEVLSSIFPNCNSDS